MFLDKLISDRDNDFFYLYEYIPLSNMTRDPNIKPTEEQPTPPQPQQPETATPEPWYPSEGNTDWITKGEDIGDAEHR